MACARFLFLARSDQQVAVTAIKRGKEAPICCLHSFALFSPSHPLPYHPLAPAVNLPFHACPRALPTVMRARQQDASKNIRACVPTAPSSNKSHLSADHVSLFLPGCLLSCNGGFVHPCLPSCSCLEALLARYLTTVRFRKKRSTNTHTTTTAFTEVSIAQNATADGRHANGRALPAVVPAAQCSSLSRSRLREHV